MELTPTVVRWLRHCGKQAAAVAAGHLRSRPDMKVGKTAPLTTFDARDRDRLALAWEMLSCSLRGPSPICPSVYSVMRKYNIILNPFMTTNIQMLLQKLC